MSYTVAQPPPAKPRPTVVKTAVLLMWATVVMQLITMVLSLLPNDQLSAALDQFYRDHPEMGGGTGGSSAATTTITVGIELLIIAGFAVLAVFVSKGAQPARIITWVLSGLAVLCLGCGSLVSAIAPSLLSADTSGQGEAAADLLELIRANTPDWIYYVSAAMNILVVLALLAVIVLLALPASNDFFRKEVELWVPPTAPAGGYPQMPPPAIPQNPAGTTLPPPPAPPQPQQPPQPPQPPSDPTKQ
jgi:hypothetical protein